MPLGHGDDIRRITPTSPYTKGTYAGAQEVTSLKEPHKLIAQLLALGKSYEHIASVTGYSVGSLQIMAKSPLMRIAQKEYAKQAREHALDGFTSMVQQEGPATLTRLKQLRDQDDKLGVALGAANAIFDRVSPRRTEHSEDRNIRVSLSLEAVHSIKEGVSAFLDLHPEKAAKFKDITPRKLSMHPLSSKEAQASSIERFGPQHAGTLE